MKVKINGGKSESIKAVHIEDSQQSGYTENRILSVNYPNFDTVIN